MMRLARATALALVLALGGGTARATFDATVTATVTPQGNGTSLFSYNVAVASSSTSPVSEFDLNITSAPVMGINTPPGALLTSITAPSGFTNDYTPLNPTIAFTSTDPSTDIAAGSSAVFSFVSSSKAVPQPFQFVDLATGVTLTGTVLAPVPEPASLVLFGLGALGALGLHARRRRTPAA